MSKRSDDQRKAMFANMSNPSSKRKSKRLKRPKYSSLLKQIKAKQGEAVERKNKKGGHKRLPGDLLEKESKRVDAMIKRKQSKEPLEGVRKHKLMTVELRKKITKLYSKEGVKDPVVHTRFFSPYSRYNLLVTEFDGKDTLYGYVSGVSEGGDEWGYSSLNEIAEAEKRGFPGLNYVERDKYFKPKKFSETDVGKAVRKPESSSKSSIESLKGSTIWKTQYAPREKFIRKNLTADARKKWDSYTEVKKIIAIDKLESKGFFRKRGIKNV